MEERSADTLVRSDAAQQWAGVPALPSPLLKSKVFANPEFGYWKITVEGSLRKSA